LGRGSEEIEVPSELELERARLTGIAKDSWYSRGASAVMIRATARVFSRYWRGVRCLELGPAEGVMTPLLRRAFPESLTVVEGAERFCRDLRERHPDVEVVHALFEQFRPDRQFDTIVMGHVLEHVDAPVEVLSRAREWLSPDGVICAAVPNARSIHRQAAVIMGLLRSEDALNEADRHHGHRRVYNPESFRAEFRTAGLQISAFGGFWLKPLSNAQIEAHWSPEMLDAFMVLGERYPDIAAEIYVIARR
jgi:2-polyprenyl-3-methyl-5-hydroxy-6-metoxy-1,4-benzoquinol methylase